MEPWVIHGRRKTCSCWVALLGGKVLLSYDSLGGLVVGLAMLGQKGFSRHLRAVLEREKGCLADDSLS